MSRLRCKLTTQGEFGMVNKKIIAGHENSSGEYLKQTLTGKVWIIAGGNKVAKFICRKWKGNNSHFKFKINTKQETRQEKGNNFYNGFQTYLLKSDNIM